MRYFLVAGEPSGDGHGSRLIKGLKAEDSSAEFRFWGGDMMALQGGEENLLHHYRDSSFFGFVDVVKNLRTISRQIKSCKEHIREFNPDVVILIDYPGFNMKIASWAKNLGIKVFYYIAPKTWASREGRVKRMLQSIDELFVIFPFEVEYFKSRGFSSPHFEGNPTVDALSEAKEGIANRKEFFAMNPNLDNRPIVALLAGSRKSEIKSIMPIMEGIADAYPAYQFVIAGVDWVDKELYTKAVAHENIKLITSQTYTLLTHSHAAIVTSGTATLETALIGTPEVVVYRIPLLLKLLKPLFLKIPYISLVNINLNRWCVSEIIQCNDSPKEAIEALSQIVEGGEQRERMLQDFQELRGVIRDSGASERFAKRIYKLLQ
ncbi:MAG: lipid-A-disaccharide synthase [Rikenellaceae bacterium]